MRGDQPRDKAFGMNGIQITPAVVEDCPEILNFIVGLARYEKLEGQVTATVELLRENLFGKRPVAEVLLASFNGEKAGIAIFFHSFSTFLGKPGIYLEDLYVKPDLRGRGIGKALLAHLASLAVARDCGRLEWSVLDWNMPAIKFYQSLGAETMAGWSVNRLTSTALHDLAKAVRTHHYAT